MEGDEIGRFFRQNCAPKALLVFGFFLSSSCPVGEPSELAWMSAHLRGFFLEFVV